MKSAVEIDRSLNQTLTILASACIHAALMVGICCSATEQKEKPIAVATKLIELKTMPLPQPPSPQPPKKETPPPKEETPPPKKETPPPKKETPPPKPPEKKPEAPKPVEVKTPPPAPAVVKTPTSKPAEPKKLTRQEDFMARFNDAPVKKDTNPPPQHQTYTPPQRPVKPVTTKSEAEYASAFKSRLSTPAGVNLPATSTMTTAEISDDYAENYVRAILYNNWHPSRGGMKYANPSPVDITFTVTPSGIPSNPRISKQSNDAAMNDSVRNLLRMLASGQIRFTSFADANITQPYLTVTVTMCLDNK